MIGAPISKLPLLLPFPLLLPLPTKAQRQLSSMIMHNKYDKTYILDSARSNSLCHRTTGRRQGRRRPILRRPLLILLGSVILVTPRWFPSPWQPAPMANSRHHRRRSRQRRRLLSIQTPDQTPRVLQQPMLATERRSLTLQHGWGIIRKRTAEVPGKEMELRLYARHAAPQFLCDGDYNEAGETIFI